MRGRGCVRGLLSAVVTSLTCSRTMHVHVHGDRAVKKLPTEVDVVIVGGGIVGSSLAYHLSKSSIPLKVVLLDASTCGSQTTGLSAGTFWSAGHASNTTNQNEFDPVCEIFANTVEIFEEVEEKGFDCGLHRCGNLTLARNERERSHLLNKHSRLLSLGYNVLLLCSHEAVCQVEPALTDGNTVAALWTLESGYVDPIAACQSLVEAAKLLSAENKNVSMTILENESAMIINNESDSSSGPNDRINICTSRNNTFSARHVVIAAGTSSPALLETLGVTAPIYPVKGTIVHFANNSKTKKNVIIPSQTIYLTEAELFWDDLYAKQGVEDAPHESGARYCTNLLDHRPITRHCYGRPTPEGEVLFGGTRIPLSIRKKCNLVQPAGEIDDIINHVMEFYPLSQDLLQVESIEAVDNLGWWSGIMPFSMDGNPLMGSLASLGSRFGGMWVAGGYGPEGIMNAPGSTLFLAQEIISTMKKCEESESTRNGPSAVHRAVMTLYNPCRSHGGLTLAKK